MRTKALFSIAAVAAALSLEAAPPRPAPRPSPPRPNVILVSIDTLRADRLNAYGYKARTLTPHLDALARDGVLFEHHVAAAPWTIPSHLSLFTSLYPSAHGVMSARAAGGIQDDAFERLAPSIVTLPRLLQDAGYATAAFTGGVTLDPRLGFGSGFDTYDTSLFKMSDAGLRKIEDWMGAQRRPFFLFWHTFEVHAPYLDARFLGEALPRDAARPVSEEMRRIEPVHASAGEEVRLLERHHAVNVKVCQALYDGGVASVDEWMGRLVAWLRAHQLYEPTLVVVTSDHGEELGERLLEPESTRTLGHFYNAHGHTLHEELVHVPLIIKLPGRPHAGRRVTAVTGTVDVAPTILDEAGVSYAGRGFQGTGLRGLWGAGPHSARSEYGYAEALSVAAREQKSARSLTHKFVLSIDGRTVKEKGRGPVPARAAAIELYDLRVDPGETRNLLATLAGPADLMIAARLEAWLRQTNALRPGRADTVTLPPETVERLRALGYVE